MIRNKISYKELCDIHCFVQISVIEFRKLTQRPENLLIAMPWWLQDDLMNYRRGEFGFSQKRDSRNQMLFGVQTQSHFKDEVVVFIEQVNTWADFVPPKIHTIKFEVYDIVKK